MKIEEHYPLKHLNTFGVDATARYFAEVRSADDLLELVRHAEFRQAKKLILGGGSNILFTQPFDGLVIRIAIPGIELTAHGAGVAKVRAGAGVNWQDLVDWTLDRNLAGLENLSLIPGTAGAAPVQNIGAYGAEFKDVFEELQAFDLETGDMRTFILKECGFGYRTSVFKNEFRGRHVILSVSLRLLDLSTNGTAFRPVTVYGELGKRIEGIPSGELTPRSVSEAVIAIRRAKLPDPKRLGNAGSFFKNPVIPAAQAQALLSAYPGMPRFTEPNGVKIPAGWLIEQCGWKGKRVGNAGCHEHQALVLVNYGPATAKEILGLAYNIQRSVREKFGIDLMPEVNIV
ncbi:MAG TPA: UDP-N-acetylmuramate dehydrogenase [Candidatus Omnitrophota bacterium]|nr:UDP-N-acetylmuramate dehydrogenase [Candidatus Omnitrophota bacterium]